MSTASTPGDHTPTQNRGPDKQRTPLHDDTSVSLEAQIADDSTLRGPEPDLPSTPKRRMGGNAPRPSFPAAEPSTPAPLLATGSAGEKPAVAEQAVQKQRMGRASTASEAAGAPAVGRQRMGGAPAASSVESTSQQPDVQAPTRMGGATAAESGMNPPVAVARKFSAESATAKSGASSSAAPSPGRGSAVHSRPSWLKPVTVTVGVLVAALIIVLAARWLRSLPQAQEFIATYPGHSALPDSAPEGIPAWLGWQHFLNMFFMVLIVRTGLQVRTERRPPGYWTPKMNSFFSPKGNVPKKVSLSQWLHQTLDVLWVANGLLFVILLFVTGQWMRIVPTSWDILPNILSTGLQYASLNWPTENGWVHYNALQLIAYCLTVFMAAPLAILSGLRMSTWWPSKPERLNRTFPIEAARAVHFPVMVYFLAFTVIHVALVFFTGILRNLNHMFMSRDAVDWWGLVVFLTSILAVAAAWFFTKPMFTVPIAGQMGTISK